MRIFTLIPAIVLWGCFGGICLAAMNFFLQSAWAPFFKINHSLSPVYQIQMICSFSILLWILGMMVADLFIPDGDPWLSSAIAGFLSGICTALVFMSITVYHDMMSHPLVFFYTNDPFLIQLFLNRLFHQWFIMLAGSLIISGILQGLGGGYHGIRQKVESQDNPVVSKLYRQRFAFLILIAILVAPLGIISTGISGGFIEMPPSCCPMPENVNASRTGPDSIRISLNIDSADIARKPSDTLPYITIKINEMEVSNQSIITGSGLEDTIDPPVGLRYLDGASVTLQGKEVSGNETDPTHLEIMVTYPNHGESAIICDRDI